MPSRSLGIAGTNPRTSSAVYAVRAALARSQRFSRVNRTCCANAGTQRSHCRLSRWFSSARRYIKPVGELFSLKGRRSGHPRWHRARARDVADGRRPTAVEMARSEHDGGAACDRQAKAAAPGAKKPCAFCHRFPDAFDIDTLDRRLPAVWHHRPTRSPVPCRRTSLWQLETRRAHALPATD
jgi:hypothetical protein